MPRQPSPPAAHLLPAFQFPFPNLIPLTLSLGTRAILAFCSKSYPRPMILRRCRRLAPPPRTLPPLHAHLWILSRPRRHLQWRLPQYARHRPPPPTSWAMRRTTFLRSRRRRSGSLRCGSGCPSSQAYASFTTCRFTPPSTLYPIPAPLHPPSNRLLFPQPHVLRFCDDRGVRDEASVVAFLKSTTMVPAGVCDGCVAAVRVTPVLCRWACCPCRTPSSFESTTATPTRR